MNFPKSWENFSWTNHSKAKIRQYGLSEKRVLRILRKPDRKETGVAPKTIAAMQVSGTKKHPTEVWMMYQLVNSKARIPDSKQKGKQIRIISAWRYPGRTPLGQPPPIPEDIINELENIIKNK